MTLKHDDTEKLNDYAVDLGPLKEVHEAKIAKRTEIEALVAQENGFGPIESLSDGAKEALAYEVDKLLEGWEREKDENGTASTGSVTFKRLANEYSALSRQIMDAQDNQVKEATERPFEHRLR